MNFWGKGLFYCQMTWLPWRRDDTIVIIASIGRTDTALIVYASRFVGSPATTFLFCVFHWYYYFLIKPFGQSIRFLFLVLIV